MKARFGLPLILSLFAIPAFSAEPDCPGVDMKYVRGAAGIQLTGNFLDCEWIAYLSHAIDRYRSGDRGEPVRRFDFRISENWARYLVVRKPTIESVEDNEIRKDPGCEIRLRVSRSEQPFWENELRCLPYGKAFDPRLDLRPKDIGAAVHALIGSYFLETHGAQPFVLPAENGGPSAGVELDDRRIRKQPYFDRFAAEAQAVLRSQLGQLPNGIRRLTIEARPTCIRSMEAYGRNRPSQSNLCLTRVPDVPIVRDLARRFQGTELEVIGFKVRAFDERGRNMLFFTFPNLTEIPYEDTILLPYRQGSFQGLLMRIQAEMAMALRMDEESRDGIPFVDQAPRFDR